MNNSEKLEALLHYCAQQNIRLEFVNGDLITSAANDYNKRLILFSTENLSEIQWIILGHEIGHILSDSDFDYVLYCTDKEFALNLELRASETAYELFEKLGLLEDDHVKNVCGEVFTIGLLSHAEIITDKEFHEECTRINNTFSDTFK